MHETVRGLEADVSFQKAKVVRSPHLDFKLTIADWLLIARSADLMPLLGLQLDFEKQTKKAQAMTEKIQDKYVNSELKVVSKFVVLVCLSPLPRE